MYHNDPKVLDRYIQANSVDPDQTAPSSLMRVYTVCHSVCIFCKLKPHSSDFRMIIARHVKWHENCGSVTKNGWMS